LLGNFFQADKKLEAIKIFFNMAAGDHNAGTIMLLDEVVESGGRNNSLIPNVPFLAKTTGDRAFNPAAAGAGVHAEDDNFFGKLFGLKKLAESLADVKTKLISKQTGGIATDAVGTE